MQYSPKLKSAAAEIKEVLKRYDIGGHVVLHTPGFAEYIQYFNPSYSVLKVEATGYRIKTDPEDPNDIKMEKLTNTINMISLFSKVCLTLGEDMTALLSMLRERIDIDEDPLRGTTGPEINN